MKKTLIFLLLGFCLVPCHAYTAYPSLAAGGGNSGLTTGSVIGYTVLGTDGVTVATARTTTGIVELGNGSYAIPAGIPVPDGSTYYVRWDRSDTSAVLGAAPTSATSYAYTLQTNLATVNTQTAPSAQQANAQAALTAQGYTTARATAMDATSANAGTAATNTGTLLTNLAANTTTLGSIASQTSAANQQNNAQTGAYAALNVAGPASPVAGSVFGDLVSLPTVSALTSAVKGGSAPSWLPGEFLSAPEQAQLLAASTAQQAGQPVTLPATPPAGYGGSAGATLAQIQALLPPNFIVMRIDAQGRVTPVLPITIGR